MPKIWTNGTTSTATNAPATATDKDGAFMTITVTNHTAKSLPLVGSTARQ